MLRARLPNDGFVEPTYAEPVQLQTQADIAVALTAAITSRMKPAAAPRRDLRPSTAVWMLLTGVGVAFLLVALVTDLDYRWAAVAVGVAQVAIGYAWIVWLTHRRDPRRGLACAIPPATFFYLARRKYAKFRPLRFVLTGAALAGLGAAPPRRRWPTSPGPSWRSPWPPRRRRTRPPNRNSRACACTASSAPTTRSSSCSRCS